MIRSWLDRAADALLAAVVGGPIRATLIGAALLWLGEQGRGHPLICDGCSIDCVVTVTFRDVSGAVQTRCVRCGGAESEPDPVVTLADVKPVRSAAKPKGQGAL